MNAAVNAVEIAAANADVTAIAAARARKPAEAEQAAVKAVVASAIGVDRGAMRHPILTYRRVPARKETATGIMARVDPPASTAERIPLV